MGFKLFYQNKVLDVPLYDIDELLKGYNPEEEEDLWEGLEDDPWSG